MCGLPIAKLVPSTRTRKRNLKELLAESGTAGEENIRGGLSLCRLVHERRRYGVSLPLVLPLRLRVALRMRWLPTANPAYKYSSGLQILSAPPGLSAALPRSMCRITPSGSSTKVVRRARCRKRLRTPYCLLTLFS